MIYNVAYTLYQCILYTGLCVIVQIDSICTRADTNLLLLDEKFSRETNYFSLNIHILIMVHEQCWYMVFVSKGPKGCHQKCRHLGAADCLLLYLITFIC